MANNITFVYVANYLISAKLCNYFFFEVLCML